MAIFTFCKSCHNLLVHFIFFKENFWGEILENISRNSTIVITTDLACSCNYELNHDISILVIWVQIGQDDSVLGAEQQYKHKGKTDLH